MGYLFYLKNKYVAQAVAEKHGNLRTTSLISSHLIDCIQCVFSDVMVVIQS